MRFTFKNKRYDKSKNYYLVAYDECNNAEAFRYQEGRKDHESF